MASIELHCIPFEGKYLVYRPLAGLAFVGNEALARYVESKASGDPVEARPEVDEFLGSIGFLAPDPVLRTDGESASRRRRPIAVLLMTNECNLRCRYCYARSGEFSPLRMDAATAEAAIRRACAEASDAGLDRFSLAFHGGGEPTLNWDVLVRSVELARGMPLRCEISMSSNAMWSPAMRDFILGNFDEVSVSFDGTERAQNLQRPKPDGGASFDTAFENILALDSSRLRYGVRMTVTDDTVAQLPEGVALLCGRTSCPVIQVEPSYSEGRSSYRDPGREQGEAFVRAFLEARDVAAAAGRQFYYSGSRPWLVTEEFCRAPREALIATPQGDIVGCYEIHDRNHGLFESFRIGSAEGGEIRIDESAEAALLSGRASRRPECQSCFNMRHCGGDCERRCLGSGDRHPGRCAVNRAITIGLLARYVAEGEGLYDRSALDAPANKPCAGCGPAARNPASGSSPSAG